jgi:hypothetical protein
MLGLFSCEQDKKKFSVILVAGNGGVCIIVDIWVFPLPDFSETTGDAKIEYRIKPADCWQ